MISTFSTSFTPLAGQIEKTTRCGGGEVVVKVGTSAHSHAAGCGKAGSTGFVTGDSLLFVGQRFVVALAI